MNSLDDFKLKFEPSNETWLNRLRAKYLKKKREKNG